MSVTPAFKTKKICPSCLRLKKVQRRMIFDLDDQQLLCPTCSHRINLNKEDCVKYAMAATRAQADERHKEEEELRKKKLLYAKDNPRYGMFLMRLLENQFQTLSHNFPPPRTKGFDILDELKSNTYREEVRLFLDLLRETHHLETSSDGFYHPADYKLEEQEDESKPIEKPEPPLARDIR